MALEFKKIISKEQDMAGKWRVMVDIGEESIMLKFNKEPNLLEVTTETVKTISSRTNLIVDELQSVKDQIKILEEKKLILEEEKMILD